MKQNSAGFQSPREWLYRLEGQDEKTPLLTPGEKQLVEEVCFEIKREIDSKDFSSIEHDSIILHKISVIEDNLKIIAHQLQTSRRTREQFVQTFPEWRKFRQQSIETLETIGNDINANRKKCNISRLVGNCTSFVGGGVCIASAALIPFTLGLSTPLAIAGGTTTVIGSATSIVTSVTEITLLKKKIKEAGAILEKDRTAFEVLKEWLTSASDVSRAVSSILAIDVDKNLEHVLQTIREFLFNIKNTFNKLSRIAIINRLVRTLLDTFSSNFAMMTVLPCLVGFLLVLTLLVNKSVFGDNKPWETMANRFSSIANISLGVLGPVAATCIKTDVAVAQSVAKAIATRGVVAVIGMSLDAASIILTSIDVHKGSISEEGVKIVDTAHKMKEEADILDRVYNELFTDF